jgi:hypothetical protein
MAGSLFNSRSSETVLSSSSNAVAGGGGATSFDRFRPQPYEMKQKFLKNNWEI